MPVVNHVSAFANSASSVTTGAISLTAGNLVVVGTSNFDASGTNDDVSVTDSVGNTYTKIGSSVLAATRHVSLWYAKNVAGGASVTFTYNTNAVQNDFPRICVVQISGADTSVPFDQSSFASNATMASSITSPAVTTLAANEILVAIGADSGTTTTETFADGGGGSSTGAWTTDEAQNATGAALTCSMGH